MSNYNLLIHRADGVVEPAPQRQWTTQVGLGAAAALGPFSFKSPEVARDGDYPRGTFNGSYQQADSTIEVESREFLAQWALSGDGRSRPRGLGADLLPGPNRLRQ